MRGVTTLRYGAIAALALLTAACGDDDAFSRIVGGAPTPTPTATSAAASIAALEASGALPRLDRSAGFGPDANTNGVRDDLDTYIAAQPYSEPQRAAVNQVARSLQQALTTSVDDRVAMDNARLANARAINCLFQQFPASGDPAAAGAAADTMERLTTNTRERLLAYLAFNRASDGIVLPSPEGDTCD